MASRTQAAVRNGLYSAAQAVVSGLAALLLYRVLLDTLGAELLGAWSLLASFTGLTLMSQLGFSAALVKHVAEMLALKRNSEIGDQIASAGVAVASLTGSALLLAYPLLDWLINDLVRGKIDSDQVEVLRSLLPLMLLSLWIGSLSGVSQRALEGFQRYDILRSVSITASILSFVLTLWAVQRFGLPGIAAVNLALSTAGMLVFSICLRRETGRVGVRSYTPGWPWMRRLLNYGSQAQLISILANVLDPLMKTMLTHFGGLASVAYFTMANRVVTQVRSLIMTAFKVLVPMVSAAYAKNAAEMPRIYRRSSNALALVGMPVMSLTLAAIPTFFASWIGRWEDHFTISGLVVAVTWIINLACAPAYYMQLGIGKLGSVTAAHGLILAMTLVSGIVLGYFFGATGVVLAFCAGQLSGTAAVLVSFSRAQVDLQGPTLEPASYRLIAVSIVAAATAATASILLRDHYPAPVLLIAVLFSVSAVLAPFIWRHPLRDPLLRAVRKPRQARDPGKQD